MIRVGNSVRHIWVKIRAYNQHNIYKTIFLKNSVLFQHDALIYNILQGSGGLYG